MTDAHATRLTRRTIDTLVLCPYTAYVAHIEAYRRIRGKLHLLINFEDTALWYESNEVIRAKDATREQIALATAHVDDSIAHASTLVDDLITITATSTHLAGPKRLLFRAALSTLLNTLRNASLRIATTVQTMQRATPSPQKMPPRTKPPPV